MGGNCQAIDIVYKCEVTRPLPKKSNLDFQRENRRAASITASYLNTRDIPIRQHFQVTCFRLHETPN